METGQYSRAVDENRASSRCVHARGLQWGWKLSENGNHLGQLAMSKASPSSPLAKQSSGFEDERRDKQRRFGDGSRKWFRILPTNVGAPEHQTPHSTMHIVHKLDETRIAQLHEFFAREWWTSDRSLEETRVAWRGRRSASDSPTTLAI